MFNTPILFLIFNRPDTTKLVFEQIRKVKPKYLYVAADGPRDDIEGEAVRCNETKKIIADGIDWECEVRTLYRQNNLGCGLAVSGAITWFFNNVEQGIVVEDDCLPGHSFFTFCETLLEYYKNNTQIFSIMGSNPFGEIVLNNEESYFFSKEFTAWGWASWRRAWEHYDYDLKNWNSFNKERIKEVSPRKEFSKYWVPLFNNLKQLESKYTWDYQWMFSTWNEGAYTIVPAKNMVSNIGFSKDATHTIEVYSPFSNIAIHNLDKIKHPKKIIIEPALERKYFKKRYYIQTRWEAYVGRFLNLFKRKAT